MFLLIYNRIDINTRSILSFLFLLNMFIIICQFSLIKHQGQKITEITILYTNNQPNILANGGIEGLFQCQFNFM
jgi:hypothetical protein